MIDEQAKLKDAIEQIDAIFALEGFTPDIETIGVDIAVLAGRVTYSQACSEMVEYAKKYKTTDGFVKSRLWA